MTKSYSIRVFRGYNVSGSVLFSTKPQQLESAKLTFKLLCDRFKGLDGYGIAVTEVTNCNPVTVSNSFLSDEEKS